MGTATWLVSNNCCASTLLPCWGHQAIIIRIGRPFSGGAEANSWPAACFTAPLPLQVAPGYSAGHPGPPGGHRGQRPIRHARGIAAADSQRVCAAPPPAGQPGRQLRHAPDAWCTVPSACRDPLLCCTTCQLCASCAMPLTPVLLAYKLYVLAKPLKGYFPGECLCVYCLQSAASTLCTVAGCQRPCCLSCCAQLQLEASG